MHLTRSITAALAVKAALLVALLAYPDVRKRLTSR